MNHTDFMAREGCNERMIGLFVENYCNSEDEQAVVSGKTVYHIKSKKGRNPTITEFARTLNTACKLI